MANIDREIHRVWAVADRDGSGSIDASELSVLMTHLNGGRPPAVDVLTRTLRVLDEDGNGRIEFAEFSKAMRAWLEESAPGITSGGGGGAAAAIDGASAEVQAAAKEGRLAAAAAAMDAGGSAAGECASTGIGSASRKSAHGMLAAFFKGGAASALASATGEGGGAAAATDQELMQAAAAYLAEDAAAAGGKTDALLQRSLGSGGAPLVDGPHGFLTLASPFEEVRARGATAATADTRLQALWAAQATAASIGEHLRVLSSGCSLLEWLKSLRAVREMLGVADYFNAPGGALPVAVRDAIIGYFNLVASTDIYRGALAFLHPRATVHAGLPEYAASAGTSAYEATSVAADGSVSGAKRRRVGDDDDGTGAKRRTVYLSGGTGSGGGDGSGSEHVLLLSSRAFSGADYPNVQYVDKSAQPLADPSLEFSFTPPLADDWCSEDNWALLREEALLLLAQFALGPRLPQTPRSSPWHPLNCEANSKRVIMANDGHRSGVAWALWHLTYSSSDRVRTAACLLLASLASYSKNTHYAVVTMPTPFAVLYRLGAGDVPFPMVEVYAATLSVLCGATLPADCLSTALLRDYFCGQPFDDPSAVSPLPGGLHLQDFLYKLATVPNPGADEVGVDGVSEETASRIRTHAVTALTYILPLMPLTNAAVTQALQPLLTAVVNNAAFGCDKAISTGNSAVSDVAGKAAASAVGAAGGAGSTLTAAEAAALAVSGGVAAATIAAVAAAAEAAAAAAAAAADGGDGSGAAAIAAPADVAVSFSTHVATTCAALRALRMILVAGAEQTTTVDLSTIDNSSAAAALAMHAATEAGIAVEDLAAAATHAIVSKSSVTVPIPVYLLAGTTVLDTLTQALGTSGARFDSLRLAALSFLLTACKNARMEPLVIAKRGLLSGLSSALASDNDDVQQRAAAVVMALVTGTNARSVVVPLLEHGLVHDLRKALAAVRAPDDVMAEAYSEVKTTHDFSFIASLVGAMGHTLLEAQGVVQTALANAATAAAEGKLAVEAEHRQVAAKIHGLIASTFGVGVIAALGTALRAVFDDCQRTITLHLLHSREDERAAATSTVEGLRAMFDKPVDGVDAQRATANAHTRMLLGLLKTFHAEAAPGSPAVREIAALETGVLTNERFLQQLVARFTAHRGGSAFDLNKVLADVAKTVGDAAGVSSILLPGVAGAGAAVGGAAATGLGSILRPMGGLSAASMVVPIKTEVAPGHYNPRKPPHGGIFRTINVARGVKVGDLLKRVRHEYNHKSAQLAMVVVYTNPATNATMHEVVAINDQAALERAHVERELRGQGKLRLVVYDPHIAKGVAPVVTDSHVYSVLITAPLTTAQIESAIATARANVSGAAAAVSVGAAGPWTVVASHDWGASMSTADDASMDGFSAASGSGSPTYAEAIAALATTHGAKAALPPADAQRLFEVFRAKQAEATATGGVAELSYAEFVSIMDGFITDGAVLTNLFHLMDKDGSGSISWDECAVGLALLVNGTLEQKMDFAFGYYDADKSGDISQAELTSMIVAALQCSPAEAAGIAAQMFAAYDEDRNGVFDRNEFKRAVSATPRLAQAFWQAAESE